MGIIKKIGIILIVTLCISTVFTTNISEANDTVGLTVSGIKTGTFVSPGAFIDVISKVLGLLRTLTGLLSIIVIAYTGFEMVTETPEGKKKVKEKMIPIVGGVLLVFMATTIATFIITVFE